MHSERKYEIYNYLDRNALKAGLALEDDVKAELNPAEQKVIDKVESFILQKEKSQNSVRCVLSIIMLIWKSKA